MGRVFLTVFLCLLAAAAGVGAAVWKLRFSRNQLPDPPALVTQIREVARLETLDVMLFKKVSFEPEPEPSTTLVGDALTWAKFTLRPPRGKAIVFADVHLGLDLSQLDPSDVVASGDTVEVHLPPLEAQVELRPGDTEVMGSNLDSQQTAQLFETAKVAFRQEVMANEALKAKARASSERAMRALLISLGYRDIRFVAAAPGTSG
jgi:hypothetical protein